MHVIVSQLTHSTPKPHLSPNYPDLAPFDFFLPIKCLAVDLTRSCVNHKNTRENCSEQSVESNLKKKRKTAAAHNPLQRCTRKFQDFNDHTSYYYLYSPWTKSLTAFSCMFTLVSSLRCIIYCDHKQDPNPKGRSKFPRYLTHLSLVPTAYCCEPSLFTRH